MTKPVWHSACWFLFIRINLIVVKVGNYDKIKYEENCISNFNRINDFHDRRFCDIQSKPHKYYDDLISENTDTTSVGENTDTKGVNDDVGVKLSELEEKEDDEPSSNEYTEEPEDDETTAKSNEEQDFDEDETTAVEVTTDELNPETTTTVIEDEETTTTNDEETTANDSETTTVEVATVENTEVGLAELTEIVATVSEASDDLFGAAGDTCWYLEGTSPNYTLHLSATENAGYATADVDKKGQFRKLKITMIKVGIVKNPTSRV